MLGEFERETFTGSPMMTFFFHYYTIFVDIVLLNVLIAIISDTYGRVEAKGAERSLLQRANLILDIEAHLDEQQLKDPELFPEWVHVLMRPDEAGTDDGVVREVAARLKDHEARMMGAFEQVREEHTAECASFTRLHSEVRELKSHMGQIAELLRDTRGAKAPPSPFWNWGERPRRHDEGMA